MQRHVFRSMGTDVELLLDAPGPEAADHALRRAAAEFRRLEHVLSRFEPGSELSRLNAHGSIDASPDLLRVVRAALAARSRTGGLFDPAVHEALVACGYDRTFERIDSGRSAPAHGSRCGGAVVVDGRRIALSPGVKLDLGGIAKGDAVDRACRILSNAGPCLVNAGGDIAVHGGRWPVRVEGGPTLELSSGAIATTGRDRRRWLRDGREMHHVIDPRTGLPAASDLLRVTVVGSSATEAEVLAKAAFLGAPVNCPRVLVLADGRTVLAGGLA